MRMYCLLNKFPRANYGISFLKKGKPKNFDFSDSVEKLRMGCSVCLLRNISTVETCTRSTDGRKHIKLLHDSWASNTFIKGIKSNIYFGDYDKCNFYTSSSISSPVGKGGYEYQDEEKREANILIGLSVFLVAAVGWATYHMDWNPYDKPIQTTSKS